MAYSDVKLDSDEKKGIASESAVKGLAAAMVGSQIGKVIPGVGPLIGAAAGLAVGTIGSAVMAVRQTKAEKALEQDIAQQQKAAQSDQAAINRSSQARQDLRDRKRQQYMFQPEDEVFLNATGGGSGYDRFMRSKYGA
jgi:phage tail tape-measure protein